MAFIIPVLGLNLNTSHVIFYLYSQSPAPPCYLFKYISCYLLSEGMAEEMAHFANLNTSHVIFYLCPHKI